MAEEEAMKSHREELEELIGEVYVDMEMNPSEDLRVEDLKEGSSLFVRFNLLDMQIKKCCTMNGRLGRKYPLILKPSVKAELDNLMDQLKEEVRTYKRLCMDKRDSFPSAVVSQPGTSVGQGDQVAKSQMIALYDKIRKICSKLNNDIMPDNVDLPHVDMWEESEDDDIKKAMVHKERWIKRMTQADDEFSTYKGLVTVWAREELSRSGSDYLEIHDYLEQTNVKMDNAIASVEAGWRLHPTGQTLTPWTESQFLGVERSMVEVEVQAWVVELRRFITSSSTRTRELITAASAKS
jgi:hypothetical protein